MYLLVGSTNALLIDTGAVPDPSEMPLSQTVRSLLQGSDMQLLPLLVVHTHGHLDHRSGDKQLADLPGVIIVGTSLSDVTRQFHLSDWPNGIAQIELGDRTVDVIPTPGHYASEVSYYDRATGLFFSGDFFLPGRLLIEDASADLASARRVAQFVAARPVSYVLGGHIELDQAGHTFLGDNFHPDERPLQLSKRDILALPAIVGSFNGFYGRNGVYVLESQNRVLFAIGAFVLATLIAVGFGIRAYLRRRRLRRAAL
jgi:glyoxylase-like metal-dependent hydrolase (beta-lactamase superfamily II)